MTTLNNKKSDVVNTQSVALLESDTNLNNNYAAFLKKYYEKHFPHESLFRLFNLNNNFACLELIFQTKTGKYPRCEDLLQTSNDFKTSILKSIPQRIEIVGVTL